MFPNAKSTPCWDPSIMPQMATPTPIFKQQQPNDGAEAFLNSKTQDKDSSALGPNISASSQDSTRPLPFYQLPNDSEVLEGVYLPNQLLIVVNPFSSPVLSKKTSKTVYLPYKIPGKKIPFQLTNMPLLAFKDKLFVLANKLEDTANSDGNTDILKQANTQGNILIRVYIAHGDSYAKNRERQIASNQDITDSYDAIHSNPGKETGIMVSMKDPASKSQEDESVMESIQMLSEKPHLAALLKKCTTAHNNSREGWRIYKLNDVTMVMDIIHAHMVLWANEMLTTSTFEWAVEDRHVSLEYPPKYLDGFVWEDIKHPLTLFAPAKQSKLETPPAPTGAPQKPDFPQVDQLVQATTIEQYMVFFP
ncbi:hypothetical protein DFH28DRAFT_1200635 [Melampsora americana]|nr:hypothetical protein DFH28DRAFT_1200635 [Melampsora americana]